MRLWTCPLHSLNPQLYTSYYWMNHNWTGQFNWMDIRVIFHRSQLRRSLWSIELFSVFDLTADCPPPSSFISVTPAALTLDSIASNPDIPHPLISHVLISHFSASASPGDQYHYCIVRCKIWFCCCSDFRKRVLACSFPSMIALTFTTHLPKSPPHLTDKVDRQEEDG